jgi:hypothetical protein
MQFRQTDQRRDQITRFPQNRREQITAAGKAGRGARGWADLKSEEWCALREEEEQAEGAATEAEPEEGQEEARRTSAVSA